MCVCVHAFRCIRIYLNISYLSLFAEASGGGGGGRMRDKVCVRDGGENLVGGGGGGQLG